MRIYLKYVIQFSSFNLDIIFLQRHNDGQDKIASRSHRDSVVSEEKHYPQRQDTRYKKKKKKKIIDGKWYATGVSLARVRLLSFSLCRVLWACSDRYIAHRMNIHTRSTWYILDDDSTISIYIIHERPSSIYLGGNREPPRLLNFFLTAMISRILNATSIS